jgi:hypothetical protein
LAPALPPKQRSQADAITDFFLTQLLGHNKMLRAAKAGHPAFTDGEVQDTAAALRKATDRLKKRKKRLRPGADRIAVHRASLDRLAAEVRHEDAQERFYSGWTGLSGRPEVAGGSRGHAARITEEDALLPFLAHWLAVSPFLCSRWTIAKLLVAGGVLKSEISAPSGEKSPALDRVQKLLSRHRL